MSGFWQFTGLVFVLGGLYGFVIGFVVSLANKPWLP